MTAAQDALFVDPTPLPHAKPDQPQPLTSRDLDAMLRARYTEDRLSNGPRYVVAPEVRNQAGFGGMGDGRLRTCDFVALDTWQSGPVRLIGHEVKVSRSDWLRELKDPTKNAPFVEAFAEFWLVVADRKIVRDGELPDGWGLLAPRGDKLAAVVRARRRPQRDIGEGMLAALMRAVDREARKRVNAARRQPFTAADVPRAPVCDGVPRESPYGPLVHGSEIQPPRHDLRRMAR